MPALDAALATLLAGGAAVFVAGGFVKGTLGLGLPLVVVPLMSLLLPAPQAMGLVVAPVLLSNLWQAIEAGRLAYLRRFTGLIAAQFVCLLLAVRFTRGLSLGAFNLIVALSVLSTVLMLALRPEGRIQPKHERWAGPLVGAIAGLMGGASSLTGPIIICYLVSLRLPRDEFVGSISMVYLAGSLPMYGAMLWWGRFGWTEVGWSVLALVPMFLGLKLGTLLRHRLSEQNFRRLLFVFLSGLSAALLFK